MKCRIVIIFLLFSYLGYSQTKDYQSFRKQMDILLSNEGKWMSTNSDYDQTIEWSAKYYGYEYEKGIAENVLNLKITGYIPSKSMWVTFWDGQSIFDQLANKVIYQSVNTNNALASGESKKITDQSLELVFQIFHADGKTEKHKDIHRFTSNSTIESESYIFQNKKWKPQSKSVWVQQPLPQGNLLFMSTRDGNFEIYSMDARGQNLKNLTCNKSTDFWMSFTPGGKQFAYYSKSTGNDEIFLMDYEKLTSKNISNHPASDRICNISPDGKQILFLSDRDHKSGEIYLMDIDGNNVKRLTNNEVFEDSPEWSVDGKQVIFAREVKDSLNEDTNGEIFIMDLKGSNEKRLTSRPGWDGGARFSPDGGKIAFYGKTEEGNSEIFIMNPDGSGIENITQDEMEDYSPAWSQDGKWIAYTKGNKENYDVWVMHLDTRIKTRLTTQPKRDESPVWVPK